MTMAWATSFDGVTKSVLVKLADHAADDGSSIFPSVPRVAKACGWSDRAVQLSLGKLQKAGVLVLVNEADFRSRRPREYQIDINQLEIAAAVETDDSRCITFTGEGHAPVNDIREPVNDIREPVNEVHPTGEGRSPKSINEPTNEQISEPPIDSAKAEPITDQLPLLDIEPAPVAKPKRKQKTAKAPELSDDDSVAFEEFWKACPKRQAKPIAQQAYAAAIESGASVGQLLIAIRRYAKQVRADGTENKFIKTPGPWLNAKRYLDEYPDSEPGGDDIRAPPRPSGRPPDASYFQAIRNVLSRTDRPDQPEEQF